MITLLLSLSMVSYAIPYVDLTDVIRDACDGLQSCALDNIGYHNNNMHPYVIFWAISRYLTGTPEARNRLFKSVLSSAALVYGKAGYPKWAKYFKDVASFNYTREQYIRYWNGKIKKATKGKYYITTKGGLVYAQKKRLFA